ncbi:hypothetical protein RNJ44_00807 [Nakaseomyces bracarensis]|uniref:Uncharacterized protein n=1 Tax=Nakaseomyces bracarensis TaxID=273131 RepID=A0ABR4NS45_9SACH
MSFLSLFDKAALSNIPSMKLQIRDSLMVRMGACRVPDRGSIPRRGDFSFCPFSLISFLFIQ